jgi:hypothetical protein
VALHPGYSVKLVNKDAAVLKFSVDKLVSALPATYPQMAARFNPDAPRTVTLVTDPSPEFPGNIAYTVGGTITVESGWIQTHLLEIDLIVHEGFHAVQSYPGKSTVLTG